MGHGVGVVGQLFGLQVTLGTQVGQQVPGRVTDTYPWAQRICGQLTLSHGVGQIGQHFLSSKTGLTLAPVAEGWQTTAWHGGHVGGGTLHLQVGHGNETTPFAVVKLALSTSYP